MMFHTPFFGSATVDAQTMTCPQCGGNDWKERDISTCNPGDVYECAKCDKRIFINWGLEEPDHLSTWINSEHCPHRLCKMKYEDLSVARGWSQ